MCVRRSVLSSTSRCVHDICQCLCANLFFFFFKKKNGGITIFDLSIGDLVGPQMGPAQTVSSCGLNLPTNHDIAIGDLAIECFGGQAIERLDVRVHVATNFVDR